MTAITIDNLVQMFTDIFSDLETAQKYLTASKLRTDTDAANVWADVVREQSAKRQVRAQARIQVAEAEAQKAEDSFNAFVESNFADPSAKVIGGCYALPSRR